MLGVKMKEFAAWVERRYHSGFSGIGHSAGGGFPSKTRAGG